MNNFIERRRKNTEEKNHTGHVLEATGEKKLSNNERTNIKHIK